MCQENSSFSSRWHVSIFCKNAGAVSPNCKRENCHPVGTGGATAALANHVEHGVTQWPSPGWQLPTAATLSPGLPLGTATPPSLFLPYIGSTSSSTASNAKPLHRRVRKSPETNLIHRSNLRYPDDLLGTAGFDLLRLLKAHLSPHLFPNLFCFLLPRSAYSLPHLKC